MKHPYRSFLRRALSPLLFVMLLVAGGAAQAADNHRSNDVRTEQFGLPVTVYLPLMRSVGPAAGPQAAPVYTYKIIHTYPHDTSAYTEGLVYANGFLYEGTGLTGGRSGIRKVALTSGQVLQSRPLANTSYFGEGIAVYNNTIVELTWQSHVGYVYDLATFNPLGQFSYPTEGWGLTFDGQRLIMSDGTSTLHFRNPQTFAETGTITVSDHGSPVKNLNELEYIRGMIYANVWLTDRVALISPQTGNVLAWADLTGLRPAQNMNNPDAVLNGIAYDPATNRLFVTGKLWPNLYEIQLVPK